MRHRKRGGESPPSWLKEHIEEQTRYFQDHPEENKKHSPRLTASEEKKWFPRMTESEEKTAAGLTGNIWGNQRPNEQRDSVLRQLNIGIRDNTARQAAHNRREAEKDAARSAERKKHWLVRTFNRWTRRQVSAKRPFHFTARQKRYLF